MGWWATCCVSQPLNNRTYVGTRNLQLRGFRSSRQIRFPDGHRGFVFDKELFHLMVVAPWPGVKPCVGDTNNMPYIGQMGPTWCIYQMTGIPFMTCIYIYVKTVADKHINVHI